MNHKMASKAPKMLIPSRSFENSFIGKKMIKTAVYSFIEQIMVLSPLLSSPYFIQCNDSSLYINDSYNY